MNSAFSLFDGTALLEAAEKGSDYAYIMFWATVSVMLAPFVAGNVIKDADESQGNQTKAVELYIHSN